MKYLEKWRRAPTTLLERLKSEIAFVKDEISRQSEVFLLHQAMSGRDCYVVPGDSFAKKSYHEIGLSAIPKSPDCLVCRRHLDPPYQLVECKYDVSMPSEGSADVRKVSDVYDDIHGKDVAFRRFLCRCRLPAADTLFVVFGSDVAPIARAELADWSLGAGDDGFRFRVFATDELINALEDVGVEFFVAPKCQSPEY